MKNLIVILTLTLLSVQASFAEKVKSPEEYLGYELGTQFTYHHDVVAYFRYVASVSDNVQLQQYGKTYEGRPLIAAFISSTENLNKLEQLRTDNLKKIGLIDGEATDSKVPFIWLNYNIHGNEACGTEASMKTLYTLITDGYEGSDSWLDQSVIIVDPCANPDGKALYTNRYRRAQSSPQNVDPNAIEHYQGWPSARANHYMFDLNRDWLWQIQIENESRLALYNQYMPQIHGDFHEMGTSSTYFFAPGATPWHDAITPWQRKFHTLTGDEASKTFNKKNKLYFTKESFDLLSPYYGDTWPLYNGSIGFTFEQGGSGYAGLGIDRDQIDTLTLAERIDGHFLATMALINVSCNNREELLSQYYSYFKSENSTPTYRSYLIKDSEDKASIKDMLALLDKNQIKYSYSEGGKYQGYNYSTGKVESFSANDKDIVIDTDQPQHNLIRVIFEPKTALEDSMTYDLTAWAVPYVYNLNAFAVKTKVAKTDYKKEDKEAISLSSDSYAYISDWKSFDNARYIAELYKKGVNIRYSSRPFTIEGDKFGRGAVIVTKYDNQKIADLEAIVSSAANCCSVKITETSTGLVSSGRDLGSNSSILQKKVKIAMVGGSSVSSAISGQMQFLFEQELKYPLTIIDSKNLAYADLSKYDIIIAPAGGATTDAVIKYAKEGGKVIAFTSAIRAFAKDGSTKLSKSIKPATAETKSSDPLLSYEAKQRASLSRRSAGGIYKVTLDTTHPYAYGMPTSWFIPKREYTQYPFIKDGGYNIGYIKDEQPLSGFVGADYLKKAPNTLVIGAERVGQGEVIYITEDIYIRGFWKSSRLLLSNMIFHNN